ncbi:MAG: hypothetical protein AAGF47_12755 [Planctomycetota bacterium]
MTDSFSRGGLSDMAALSFGPYELVRPLRHASHAERYLAVQPERLTNHVAYRVTLDDTAEARQLFLDAIDSAAAVTSPHALPIEQFSMTSPIEAWVISPFVGDHDGLLLLSDLLGDKGGMLEPAEVRRAVGQLLEAADAGAQRGLPHGPLGIDDVQVDRRGSIRIELYGLRAAADPSGRDADDLHQDEVRDIIAIGYELLTGIRPQSASIDPKRLVPSAPDDLCALLRSALDSEPTFATAREALEALAAPAAGAPQIEVRVRTGRRGFGFAKRRSNA